MQRLLREGLGSGYRREWLGSGYRLEWLGSGYRREGLGSGYRREGLGSGYRREGLGSGYRREGLGSGYRLEWLGSGYRREFDCRRYKPSKYSRGRSRRYRRNHFRKCVLDGTGRCRLYSAMEGRERHVCKSCV